MKSIIAFIEIVLCLITAQQVEANLHEPENVPAELRGMEPHKPAVAKYYLHELVRQGKMTESEAEQTELYMIFRDARRMQDLKEVKGFSKIKRRAYMKKKREIRGNPLKEYAEYCGISYERARELMDAMHKSNKGSLYYEKL